MSDWWWYVLVVVAIVAAVGFLYLRRRSAGASGGAVDRVRDYQEERETNRLGGMSDEDRAWETESLERSKGTKAPDQSPPERG